MAVNETPDFSKLASELKDEAVRFASVHALEFFRESFFKEGFTDTSFIAWQKSKNREGYKTLTGTTNLRESLRILSRAPSRIVFGTDVPYAKIHNEGGTVNVPVTAKSRKFFWFMYKATGKDQWKWMALTKKDHFSFQMPKRQFIGESQTLMRELDKWLINRINQKFNQL